MTTLIVYKWLLNHFISYLPSSLSSPVRCRRDRAAGIDPKGSPHPRIQYSEPLQKDPHPEPASGRALTPSRTRFSSPLAIAREQDGLVPTTFPEGTQPRRVPAQWPRALAKLTGNIPSRGHWISPHRCNTSNRFPYLPPIFRGKRAKKYTNFRKVNKIGGFFPPPQFWTLVAQFLYQGTNNFWTNLKMGSTRLEYTRLYVELTP